MRQATDEGLKQYLADMWHNEQAIIMVQFPLNQIEYARKTTS